MVTQSLADQQVIKLALKEFGLKNRLNFYDDYQIALQDTILMYHGNLRSQCVGLVCFDADLFQNDTNALSRAIRDYRNSLVQTKIKDLPTCVIIHTPTNDTDETITDLIGSHLDLSDCKLLTKPIK